MAGQQDWRLGLDSIAEMNLQMLQQEIRVDCSFLVGEQDGEVQEFKAHKFILARASPVFEDMFYGTTSDDPVVTSQGEQVKINDLQPHTFALLLNHVYTDEAALVTCHDACLLAKAAAKYQVAPLQAKCVTFLSTNLSTDTTWRTLEVAVHLQERALIAACIQRLQTQTRELLQSSDFADIPASILSLLQDQDYLSCSEHDLWLAVLHWGGQETLRRGLPSDEASIRECLYPDILSRIRFLSMSPEQFSEGPAKSNVLTADEKLSILMNINSPGNTKLIENISTNSHSRIMILERIGRDRSNSVISTIDADESDCNITFTLKTNQDIVQKNNNLKEVNDDKSIMKVKQTTQNVNKGYEISIHLSKLHKIVTQYASKGRYDVSISVCLQALEKIEKAFGHYHPDVATILSILALIYRDKGDYKPGASLLNDALAIREKTLGIDHLSVAATLNNLAVMYSKRGKFKKAEILCRRALEIRKKILGNDHPDVAKQLSNIAQLCQNQGDFENAEQCYQTSLSIYETKYGIEDCSVNKTKNKLASCNFKQGKYEEAEVLYKQVLTQAAGDRKAIWEVAESHKEVPSESSEVEKKSMWELGDDQEEETSTGYYKPENVDLPTFYWSVKKLGEIYKQQGKIEAAKILEDCAVCFE